MATMVATAPSTTTPSSPPALSPTTAGAAAVVAANNNGVTKRYRPAPAKTFQCRGYGECRMVFSRSEHLARHIRKHTGERPFTCHCGKQFSRLDNLRQHAQTVHADKQEENEKMMRELSALHATMSAASKGPTDRTTPPRRQAQQVCGPERRLGMKEEKAGSISQRPPRPSAQAGTRGSTGRIIPFGPFVNNGKANPVTGQATGQAGCTASPFVTPSLPSPPPPRTTSSSPRSSVGPPAVPQLPAGPSSRHSQASSPSPRSPYYFDGPQQPTTASSDQGQPQTASWYPQPPMQTSTRRETPPSFSTHQARARTRSPPESQTSPNLALNPDVSRSWNSATTQMQMFTPWQQQQQRRDYDVPPIPGWGWSNSPSMHHPQQQQQPPQQQFKTESFDGFPPEFGQFARQQQAAHGVYNGPDFSHQHHQQHPHPSQTWNFFDYGGYPQDRR